MKHNPKNVGARWNSVASDETRTVNYEGGLAFSMTEELELYERMATDLGGEDKFYETGSQSEDRFWTLFDKVVKRNPEFVLKLAVHGRKHLFLRTKPIEMLVRASLVTECKPYVRKYAPHIIERADEPTVGLGYLISIVGQIGDKGKGTIPMSLMHGVADTFYRFNEYHLAKWDRDNRAVKMKDVIRLFHPKPLAKDDRYSRMWKAVIDGTLETPETWETNISQWRERGFKSKAEAWDNVVRNVFWRNSRVNNYMAILANIRNVLEEKGISADTIRLLAEAISNPEAVRHSKLFTYRFYSAYKAVKEMDCSAYAGRMLDALEAAMDISVENLPRLNGTTLIMADNSGSMNGAVSEKSTVSARDIANLFLVLSHKLCEFPMTGFFASNVKMVNLSFRNGVLGNMQEAQRVGGETGESTYGYKVIRYLLENKIKVDRLMLFTDGELYNETGYDRYSDISHSYSETFATLLYRYRAEINPKMFLYTFNLRSGGHLLIPEKDKQSLLVAGYTDKVLQFIPEFEAGGRTMVEKIQTLQIPDWPYRRGKVVGDADKRIGGSDYSFGSPNEETVQE